jgi:hypothetical protein
VCEFVRLAVLKNGNFGGATAYLTSEFDRNRKIRLHIFYRESILVEAKRRALDESPFVSKQQITSGRRKPNGSSFRSGYRPQTA